VVSLRCTPSVSCLLWYLFTYLHWKLYRFFLFFPTTRSADLIHVYLSMWLDRFSLVWKDWDALRAKLYNSLSIKFFYYMILLFTHVSHSPIPSRINCYLDPGTEPAVGQPGLEPPYRWWVHGAPLSPAYKFPPLLSWEGRLDVWDGCLAPANIFSGFVIVWTHPCPMHRLPCPSCCSHESHLSSPLFLLLHPYQQKCRLVCLRLLLYLLWHDYGKILFIY
jgi:hypothetical protein